MDNSASLFSFLNKPISEKIDLLIGKPIESGITSGDILKDVVSLIFDYAVLEPTFCPMFAQLCSGLNRKLRRFPSEKPGGKEISVNRVLLNICQEAFEGLDKPREGKMQMYAPWQESARRKRKLFAKQRGFGSVRLIGELFKLKMVPKEIVHHIIQKLLGSGGETCLEEENVEAMCQFLHIVSKRLDKSQASRRANDIYFNRLKELSTRPQLAPRIRFMVREILDLRSNKYVPWREEEKAKIFSEIHNEEKNTRLRHPGSTSNIPGSQTPPPTFRKKPLANQRFPPPREVGFTIARYNALVHDASGSYTPVRTEEYFWYPVDYQVAIRTQSNVDEIKRITVCLLNEYFSVLILDDVLQFVNELKPPYDYPEFVKESILLFLDRSPPCVEPIAKLLDYLLLNKILVKTDLIKGCKSYALQLDEIDIDTSFEPNDFGEFMGHLVLSGGVDFKVVGEVIDEMERMCMMGC